jgi:hypothetical protein
LRRLRLEAASSSWISASTVLWNSFRPRGGNSAEGGHLAADNAHGVDKPKNSSCLIGLREEVVDTVRDERRKSTD